MNAMTVTANTVTPAALDHYQASCTILTAHVILILQNGKLRRISIWAGIVAQVIDIGF